MLDNRRSGRAHGGDQSALDLGSGRVAARVQDAGVGVCCLETLAELTVFVAIERDPERDKLPDPLRALRRKYPHRCLVAEPRPGDERVVDVVFDAVIGEHDSRDPALRVARVGVLQNVFGDDCHAAAARRRVEGDGQACDAAADDDHARRGCHDACSQAAAGAAGGLAASIRSRATRAGSATSVGTVMRLTTSPATSDSSTHAR